MMLGALIATYLGENLASGRWYVFSGRPPYDGEGSRLRAWRVLHLVRAAGAGPVRVARSAERKPLSRTEFSSLLEGIDITVRCHRKRYAAPPVVT